MEAMAATSRARLSVLFAVGYGAHGSPEAAAGESGVTELGRGVWPVSGTWTDTSSTPPWLQGRCDTVWTSSVGAYRLPYRVDFVQGLFRWRAPKTGAGHETEVGVGTYLGPLKTIARADGSWETGYFGANRYTPDDTQSTNCCCEYVGQSGPGQPTVLADYCVAAVPRSQGVSMREACAPYLQECPADNATAAGKFGKPFIEVYSPCRRHLGEAPRQPSVARAAAALAAALLLVLGLWRLAARRGSRRSWEDGLSRPFLCSDPEEKGCAADSEKPRRSPSWCSKAGALLAIARRGSKDSADSSESDVPHLLSTASMASTCEPAVGRGISECSVDSALWSPVV